MHIQLVETTRGDRRQLLVAFGVVVAVFTALSLLLVVWGLPGDVSSTGEVYIPTRLYPSP